MKVQLFEKEWEISPERFTEIMDAEKYGGLIIMRKCPKCGLVNAPHGRNDCDRCGAALAEKGKSNES